MVGGVDDDVGDAEVLANRGEGVDPGDAAVGGFPDASISSCDRVGSGADTGIDDIGVKRVNDDAPEGAAGEILAAEQCPGLAGVGAFEDSLAGGLEGAMAMAPMGREA